MHRLSLKQLWKLIILEGILLELWALKYPVHEATFSEWTETVFRTESPRGRLAFIASWSALYFWYTRHIAFKKVVELEEELADESLL